MNRHSSADRPGIIILALVSVLLTGIGSALAQSEGSPISLRNAEAGLMYDQFIFEIGRFLDGELGETGEAPVTKLAGSEPIYGFDFLIGYETELLTLTDVTPGVPFEEPYNWEYFTYRQGPFGSCDSSCPSGLVRIVGLYDINDGNPNTADQSFPDDAEFFTLVFQITGDSAYECNFTPVRFFWLDCGDNMVVFGEPSGNLLAISEGVYDIIEGDMTDPAADFPTYGGTPDACLGGGSPDSLVRTIYFSNGAVDVLCIDPLDDRGDVNLNGIPYEIADFVVFTSYFIYGPAAFSINYEGQAAATDINYDGELLTIEDLIYLARVIQGQLMPIAKSDRDPFDYFSGTLNLLDTDSSIIISCDFEDSVAGLYMTFESPAFLSEDDYDIYFLDGIDSIYVAHAAADSVLRILCVDPPYYIGDSLSDAVIDSGFSYLMEIFYDDPKPVLTHAEASGNLAEYVYLTITASPDNPPVFDSVPATINNTEDGSFSYDFDAYDDDLLNDNIHYDLLSGPGEIDPVTGVFSCVPVCQEVGVYFAAIEVCAADNAHPCPQGNPDLHVTIELAVTETVPLVGDADHDDVINLNDVMYIIAFLYNGGPAPVPGPEVADARADGRINVLDLVHLIAFLYLDGPEPECP